MTPTEREEGRLLLEKFNTSVADNPQGSAAISAVRPLRDWLLDHADALLAEPAEIDIAEIARAAVREFAESVLDIWPDESVMRDDSEFMRGSVGAVGITRDAIRKLAAARGVTLEKP